MRVLHGSQRMAPSRGCDTLPARSARTLRVFEQEARTISGNRHRKEAKSGSKRTVILPEFVAAVLRGYQRGQMKWRLKLGRAWEDNDLILAKPGGHRPRSPVPVAAAARGLRQCGHPSDQLPHPCGTPLAP